MQANLIHLESVYPTIGKPLQGHSSGKTRSLDVSLGHEHGDCAARPFYLINAARSLRSQEGCSVPAHARTARLGALAKAGSRLPTTPDAGRALVPLACECE